MNTFTLLSGLTLAVLPGAALFPGAAQPGGDECAAVCETPATASSCCMAGAAASAATPVALASTAPVGERGMIGVYLGDQEGAALIEGLVDGGPAEQAGLQAGDRIVAVGDQRVTSWSQLRDAVGRRQAGETVSITVERDGWNKVLELTLAPAPAPPAEDGAGSSFGMGTMSTGPMTLELAEIDEHAAEEHENEHEHEHEHEGQEPQVFTLQRGAAPMVIGRDGKQWLAQVQPQGGQGMVYTDVRDGNAKAEVVIKALKDGKVVDVEGLDLSKLSMDLSQLHQDLDVSELHESLGKLKGLRITMPKGAEGGACCDPSDEECCKGDASGDAKVLHLFGTGGVQGMAGKQPGEAKGIIVHRLGAGDGVQQFGDSGEFELRVEGAEGADALEWKMVPGQPLGQPGAQGGRMIRRGMPLNGGGDEDLQALRSELHALRAELQEIRQSLRRIQAGQR